MPSYVHLWNKDNQPANCVRCGILAAVPAQAERVGAGVAVAGGPGRRSRPGGAGG